MEEPQIIFYPNIDLLLEVVNSLGSVTSEIKITIQSFIRVGESVLVRIEPPLLTEPGATAKWYSVLL